LNKLGNSTLLIQILFRKRDLLDTIDTIYFVDNQNKISHSESRKIFTEKPQIYKTDKPSFVLPKRYSDNLIETGLLVELNNINVNYEDKKVLHNLNWTIKKGEFWQLIGPNGSGKSTLVSMISGDNPKAYRQDITLFGRKKGSGESIWDIKSKIGYFTPAMIHQFRRSSTVEEMIISGIVDSVGLYIQPTDIQKDIANEWLHVLGIKDKKTLFQKISLGQQRMVMVARAMVKHPALLILDEPTIELDDENTLLFIDLIQAIAREKDTAIIYISHRDEDNLNPNKIFELIKTENGYTGIG
jgi:molybdate transport system ATP-binding protein